MGRNERAFAIPLLCGFIGVILAIFFQLLYAGGVIIDEVVIGTITLREVQLIVILIWTLFGVVVAGIQR